MVLTSCKYNSISVQVSSIDMSYVHQYFVVWCKVASSLSSLLILNWIFSNWEDFLIKHAERSAKVCLVLLEFEQ